MKFRLFVLLSLLIGVLAAKSIIELTAMQSKKEDVLNYHLPPLPYAYNALEPYIDARTMEIHYTKHHQGYVNKLNKALENYPELQKKTVKALLQSLSSLPEAIRTAVRHNGGGDFNHSLFWTIMCKDGGGEPKGELAAAIKKYFGSFEIFKKEFSEQARTVFGSGWTWLASKPDGTLFVTSTSGHDSPVMDGNIPLLVIDVWEHAYYLKYQYKRPDFIDAWWHVVNWDNVANYYREVLNHFSS